MSPTPTIRQARADDVAAVQEFTGDTWTDRERPDYLPRVFERWVETDGDDQRTFVAEVDAERDAEVVGVGQALMLSPDEAWSGGLRVAPEARNQGVGSALLEAGFRWARERGATVSRCMVFSWNVMGLGTVRAAGFEPVTEFRWAQPDPDAEVTPTHTVHSDATAAWRYWTGDAARTHLGGLALSPSRSWALVELTRETLETAAAEGGLFVVARGGTSGMAFRRGVTTEGVDGREIAEYGVAAWDGIEDCRALMDAIANDAADLGVDETRVLIPETPRHVSDVAAARVAISSEPDFVVAADLTTPRD